MNYGWVVKLVVVSAVVMAFLSLVLGLLTRLSHTRNDNVVYMHSFFAIVFFSIMSLAFGIYSAFGNAFSEQGNRVLPVINAIKKNKTEFYFDEIYKDKRAGKLVFAIDVSKSSKRTEIKIEDSWFKAAIDVIEECHELKKPDDITDPLSNLSVRNATGLDIIKIKVCKLLIETRHSLMSDERFGEEVEREYPCYLFTYGKSANLECEFDLLNRDDFNLAVKSVMDIEYKDIQGSKTDNARLIQKINVFVPPADKWSIYQRPHSVINIFGDFINDTEKESKDELEELIYELTSTSTYFNLYHLPHRNEDANKINILKMFKSLKMPGQVNFQNISDELEIKLGSLLGGRSIVFLVDPSHVSVKSEELFVKANGDHGNVDVTLLKSDSTIQQGVQFNLDSSPLRVNKSVSTNPFDKSFSMFFTGDAVRYRQGCFLNFLVSNKMEDLTFPIVICEKLPTYVGYALCILGVWMSILLLLYMWIILSFAVGLITGRKVLYAEITSQNMLD